MIKESLKAAIPRVSRRWQDILLEEAKDIAANGMIRFAVAASRKVPIWTGYTKSVWVGVITKAQEDAQIPISWSIGVRGKHWYFPFWPHVDHSKTAIIDNKHEEQARGEADGYKALKKRQGKTFVTYTVTIPSYARNWRQEHTYDYMESDWQSLAAGKLAFEEYKERAWAKSTVLKGILGAGK